MKILNFLNLTSQNGMIPTINEPTMVSLEKKKKKKNLHLKLKTKVNISKMNYNLLII